VQEGAARRVEQTGGVLQPWTCTCGQRNAGPAPCPRCLTPAPPDVVATPVVLDASPRRPGWFVPLAVLVALLLVSATAAAFVVDGDGGPGRVDMAGRTITVSPNDPPPQLPGADAELAAALPEMMRFIEQARGLTFKRPVKVTLLGDEAFRARLRDADRPDDEDRERTKTTERVLQAYGLLDRDVDLEKATESLLGDAVLGYYDTEEDDLVVRGEELTPYVRSTFVHELTHALQDQWFDLDREDIDERDDEASTAFTSVIEGDAVRIEQQYLDSLPEEQQKQAEMEELAGGGIDPGVPRILLELIGFPYAAGPQFANEVVAKAGQPRLDEAFRNPPTTTEEIMHPEVFLAGGKPKPVTEPKPDKGEEAIDEGVLGEYGLLLVLSRFVDLQEVLPAVHGWGGDRYVAWRDGNRTCARTNVVMDSADDARELRAALAKVAEENDELKVGTSGGAITFRSCG
jgi:hypothetical protein